MTDLFQDKARDWDQRDIPRQLSEDIGACLLENLKLRREMRVMDFGAGTGLIAGRVASQVSQVTAVDISQAMLEKLAAKDELRGKVEVRCQNILEAPMAERFDLIVSAMAMHHVEDTDQLVQSFATHLKPGGQVALADLDAEDGSFHPPGTEGVYHAGFERDALQALLEKHGFDDVRFFTPLSVQKEDRSYPVFLVVATLAS